MKVLIAMDSFKGTFSSIEAAALVEKGIKKVYKDAVIDKVSIADGGEGTVETLVESLNGKYVYKQVKGPLGETVKSNYGIIYNDTAVIEMSKASGLTLVPEDRRNPLYTTTYGTGELIKDALDNNCSKIIIGIGGSATNDGGAGMAAALGARFLNRNGSELPFGGGALGELDVIDLSGIDKRIKNTKFLTACDVTNPLCGKNGASYVFGPQKGATPETIKILDANLKHYADIIKEVLGKDITDLPGAGAAGGLGAGLAVFLGAQLEKGIDIILDIIKIEERIKECDIVITGEGKLDSQTVYGKVPAGIASRAKKYGKAVFAIPGFIGEGGEKVYEHGIDSIMSPVVAPITMSELMNNSDRLIIDAAERLFRIIRAVSL